MNFFKNLSFFSIILTYQLKIFNIVLSCLSPSFLSLRLLIFFHPFGSLRSSCLHLYIIYYLFTFSFPFENERQYRAVTLILFYFIKKNQNLSWFLWNVLTNSWGMRTLFLPNLQWQKDETSLYSFFFSSFLTFVPIFSLSFIFNACVGRDSSPYLRNLCLYDYDRPTTSWHKFQIQPARMV